jgi:hypothetical protein
MRATARAAHGGGLLAVGAKLRPQLHDRGVVAEEPPLGEHVCHRRGHALADRVAVDRGVRRDRTAGRRVGDARDGVDHLVAMAVDGDLQAPLGS